MGLNPLQGKKEPENFYFVGKKSVKQPFEAPKITIGKKKKLFKLVFTYFSSFFFFLGPPSSVFLLTGHESLTITRNRRMTYHTRRGSRNHL